MKQHFFNLITGAATVAALSLGTTSFGQNPNPPPAVVYQNGTAAYVAPAPTATAPAPASSAPTVTYVTPAPAPAATATAPARVVTTPVPVATTPAGSVTYVTPAPGTTYVAPAPAATTTTVVTPAPAPAAGPISEAGRDYDHVRVSMTPATGEPTGDQVPTTSQKLIDGAQWIRKELIKDIDIAHQDITIVPANARITLYGRVPTEEMKAKIEGIARTAGSPSLVVSDLKVR